MSGLLTIDGIHTAYDRVDVLHGVSLTVAKGTITCILGANGAGKSTLIRSVLGLTPAHIGTIKFDGQPIGQRSFGLLCCALQQIGANCVVDVVAL